MTADAFFHHFPHARQSTPRQEPFGGCQRAVRQHTEYRNAAFHQRLEPEWWSPSAGPMGRDPRETELGAVIIPRLESQPSTCRSLRSTPRVAGIAPQPNT
jgi:hypothetical protein